MSVGPPGPRGPEGKPGKAPATSITLRKQGRRNAVAYFGLLVCVTVALFLSGKALHRQARDERNGCHIQARGLLAQPHLTRIMGAISQILNAPASGSQPVPPQYAVPLSVLHRELPIYIGLERQQPRTRKC